MELSANKDYAPVLAARFLLCFPSNSSLYQDHLTLSSGEVSVFGPEESQQWLALWSCRHLIKHLHSEYKVREFISQDSQMYKNVQRQVHKTKPSKSYTWSAVFNSQKYPLKLWKHFMCITFHVFHIYSSLGSGINMRKQVFAFPKGKWKCKVFHSWINVPNLFWLYI